MSVKLYNTGTTKAYDQKELNRIFETKGGEYLESNKVPIINRKFNWIPTGGKGDPPRSMTDAPANKTLYANNNVGVLSDFPKSNTAHDIGNMWLDGTYADMVRDVDDSNEEFYKMLKFAPDNDFDLRYARLQREEELPVSIAQYFNAMEQDREEDRRIYLEEFGLSPDEIREALSKKRVADALKGLETGKRLTGGSSKQMEKAIAKATGAIRDERGMTGSMDILGVKAPMEASDTHMTLRARRTTRYTPEQVERNRRENAEAMHMYSQMIERDGIFGGAGGADIRVPSVATTGLPLTGATERIEYPASGGAGRPFAEDKGAKLNLRRLVDAMAVSKKRYDEVAKGLGFNELHGVSNLLGIGSVSRPGKKSARSGRNKTLRNTGQLKGGITEALNAGKHLAILGK